MEQKYCLNPQEHEKLVQELKQLLKEKFSLEQKIREQITKENAEKEQLFLELLELFDGLESLITYLQNNPEPNPRFIQRLPKSLGSLQKKLLTILKRRDVTIIEHSQPLPDYQFCQVVDRETRNDLEENTITKIVRQGFWSDQKVLRPLEVITSKTEEEIQPSGE
ncbi:UNVERIFIED_CONTAM: nucleotide exchange factor GrpE [Euhalothece sp. KZN 001]